MKAQDMEIGKWYVGTIINNWIFKVAEKSSIGIISDSYHVMDGEPNENKNPQTIFSYGTTNIREATLEEVAFYFPNENYENQFYSSTENNYSIY